MSLRTPLARARGLGSAKEGVEHWWMQRLTAIALLPLTLWFVFSIALLAGADGAQAQAWVAFPMNAIMLSVWVVALFHHSQLGLQVVLEDYVHHEGLKIASLILIKFTHFVAGAAAIFAILKIAFTA